MMEKLSNLLDEPAEVLPRRHSADRPGEHIVEQQRRNRKLCQTTTHGGLHHPVDPAPDEHGTGLYIERAYRSAEQHYGQDEPRSALTNYLLSITGHIIGRRGQVGKNDGGSTPERDEGQHHRGGDEDPYCRFGSLNGCSHA